LLVEDDLERDPVRVDRPTPAALAGDTSSWTLVPLDVTVPLTWAEEAPPVAAWASLKMCWALLLTSPLELEPPQPPAAKPPTNSVSATAAIRLPNLTAANLVSPGVAGHPPSQGWSRRLTALGRTAC
jgi:hypothetical protein